MCAGAIIYSRIERLVFGISNVKTGCFGSTIDISRFKLDGKLMVEYGVCEKEIENL